ncbi:hypothetical protein LTR53_002871 [Teratosphaeriaceae sp. CCFEE 6253]|nr:hypothetical protein LTR53_002871 [Teratosphaeriaceae sp. CCFEE 6253]
MPELTFVHQYSGDTPKRRRLAKACEPCRARKKRCVHFDEPDKDGDADLADGGRHYGQTNGVDGERVDSVGLPDQPFAAATTTSSGDTHPGAASAALQQEPSPPSARGKHFISDLIPASTLLHRAREEDRGRLLPNDDIGIWIDKLEYDELVRRRKEADGEEAPIPPRATERDSARSTLNYGLPGDQRPHSAVLGPLVDVYFSRIHPILPLVDEAEFRSQQAEGEAPEPLIHALCLVAAKDATAALHLKLGSSPSTLPPREFCSRLHASVTGALRAPCQYDKVTLVRILALASMHSEGADGAEESSMLLSQAMHHAQTMAIHLGQSNGQAHANVAMKRLFWCLWILDRSNSVMHGRPVIMSDPDIALAPFRPRESGFPAFEAWLRITELLNKIIAFYRPHYPLDVTGWEDQYPGLEEILDDVQGWDLPASLHRTIHLYYLATAVLSHRSRGIKQIPRGTHSAVRQRLCASEIIRLVEAAELEPGELHALPFVPYAVSLTLSVAYQHLRQSQFVHQQEDACREFRTCTRLLQGLRRTWSSADTMAGLARKVQGEIERAPSLVSFRVARERQRGVVVDVPCMPALNGERMGLEGSTPVASNGADGGVGEEGLGGGDDVAVGVEARQSGKEAAGLFDGMDDVFGTYMDPNYPVNLDDLSFLDDLQPLDYDNAGYAGGAVW